MGISITATPTLYTFRKTHPFYPNIGCPFRTSKRHELSSLNPNLFSFPSRFSKFSELSVRTNSLLICSQKISTSTKSKLTTALFSDQKERKENTQWKNAAKFALCSLISVSIHLLISESAYASSNSIRASALGLKIADFLRGSGWRDEVIVFSLATLPVLELRGAIPVGYWMKLNPLLITFLSIIGNMVPVPFIILFLRTVALFLSRTNVVASKLVDMLFKRAKDNAGMIEEFQWLGLMLFVAVPFPGTGAWSGAIIASILGMPFWLALSANFFGVILAAVLVTLLVNLGLKYAVITDPS